MVEFGIERQVKAYSYLFEIENLLRVAMHNVLIAKKGIHYFTADVLPKFMSNIYGKECEIDILKEVSERKGEEKKIKILIGYDYNLLWYIDFPNLLAALLYFWDTYFIDIFLVPKDSFNEITNFTKEARRIRNSLAHNRYLSIEEYTSLQSFYSTLKKIIKTEYKNLYNELTFTKIEDIKKVLLDITDEILIKLSNGLTIPNMKSKNLEIILTSLGQMSNIDISENEISNLLRLIRIYNTKFSRKPGSKDQMEEFINSNGLIIKFENLKKVGI